MIESGEVAELEALELDLLLRAVQSRYGYDFHDYAKASIIRRVKKHLDEVGVGQISELIPLFLRDSRAFYRFVKSLSVVVTEMFRDPEGFWCAFFPVCAVSQSYFNYVIVCVS